MVTFRCTVSCEALWDTCTFALGHMGNTVQKNFAKKKSQSNEKFESHSIVTCFIIHY